MALSLEGQLLLWLHLSNVFWNASTLHFMLEGCLFEMVKTYSTVRCIYSQEADLVWCISGNVASCTSGVNGLFSGESYIM
ncbi:MAG: hypothetical protein A2Z14_11295 [Chloroflexi bacterium RBG_16_48_8]|nr:MAG: hypothetical protein A2Z14_11295 [Chloroflexi bacterium RBG_16_48_8]